MFVTKTRTRGQIINCREDLNGVFEVISFDGKIVGSGLYLSILKRGKFEIQDIVTQDKQERREGTTLFDTSFDIG